MRLKALPLLVVLSAMVFSSCQKEIDFTINRTSSGTNDSIYLKLYVETDTTLPAGLDSLYKIDFNYDNQKRLTSYLLTEFINNLSQVILTEVKYYYNGSDTLPFKTTEHVIDGAYSYLDTTYFNFQNGKVSFDSVIFYRENNHELLFTNTSYYIPSGNNIFVRNRIVDYLIGTPRVTIDSGMINITRTGNNITSQTTNAPVANEEYYQLAYDTKINPFYRIDIHYPIYGGFNSSFDTSPNNLISEQAGVSSGNLSRNLSISYTYRTDGYPVVSRITDLLDPSNFSKGFYYYTR